MKRSLSLGPTIQSKPDFCPTCDGRRIIKRGLRKNCFRRLQIYSCKVGATWEDFCEKTVPEGADDRADLVPGYDPAIQFVRIVGDVLVSLCESDTAGLAVTKVNVITSINC